LINAHDASDTDRHKWPGGLRRRYSVRQQLAWETASGKELLVVVMKIANLNARGRSQKAP